MWEAFNAEVTRGQSDGFGDYSFAEVKGYSDILGDIRIHKNSFSIEYLSIEVRCV